MFDFEVAALWNTLDVPFVTNLYELDGWKPKCLLDALFFLRVCSAEATAAATCGRDVKTLRKWNWRMVKATAFQEWVS